RVGVVARQRMPVGDEVEAVVLVLHRHPVAEGAHQVTEVQAAGRPHAGDDTRFPAGGRFHCDGSRERMNRNGGMTIASKPPVRINTYSRMNPYGRMRLNVAAAAGGSRPARTLPPSSGGIGIMLNTASSTFNTISRVRIVATGAETFAASSVCGVTGKSASRLADANAMTRLLAGPAAATST